jgi:hypothetical protein
MLLVLISIMIGVIVAAIIHNHDVKTYWWAHILIVLATIFITLAVHELTHAFIFSINKIKIKAVYLFMFMFIRKGKCFTLKVNPKLLLLGGGLVVPKLPPITNDDELDVVKDKLAKSLIAAPIVSIIFGFLMFIIFLLLLFLSPSLPLISYMITSTFTILILTVLVIIASSASNEMAAGDFVAYNKVKNEPDYLLQVISSYIHFNEEAKELSQEYLLNNKITYLLNHGLNYNIVTYSYIIDYLEAVIFENYKRNHVLENQILSLNRNILNRTNEGISVLFLISYLHYISGDDVKTFELLTFLEATDNPKVSEKHLTYELKKAHHLLNISDELDFLKNKKNLEIGLNWIFEPLFDNQEDKTLNVKLKKGIKIPKISFYNRL